MVESDRSALLAFLSGLGLGGLSSAWWVKAYRRGTIPLQAPTKHEAMATAVARVHSVLGEIRHLMKARNPDDNGAAPANPRPETGSYLHPQGHGGGHETYRLRRAAPTGGENSLPLAGWVGAAGFASLFLYSARGRGPSITLPALSGFLLAASGVAMWKSGWLSAPSPSAASLNGRPSARFKRSAFPHRRSPAP